MDALVMCGGRGTRLDTRVEKPLFEIDGTPMVSHVLAAVQNSSFDEIATAVSPHAPETKRYLAAEEEEVNIIETPGEGYVEDLGLALDKLSQPTLTVAADLPVLDGEAIEQVRSVYGQQCESPAESLTICVPTALKRVLDVSHDRSFDHDGQDVTPAGINIVGAGESEREYIAVSYDLRLAINVNRLEDAAVAEELL